MSETRFNHLMLALLSVIAVFIPFRELISLYTFSFVKVIPDLCVLIALIAFLIYKKFWFKFDKVDIAFLAFLAFGFVTTVLFNHLEISRYILECRSIALYYILYFILKNIRISDEISQKVGRVLQYVVLIIVIFAIIEKVTYKELLFPEVWKNDIIYMNNYIRAYSFFNNPNSFAAFLIFAFIYIYQIFGNPWDKRNAPFTLLTFVGILISVSRSTIILLGVFLIGVAILKKYYMLKKQKKGLFTKNTLIIILLSFVCWGCIEGASKLYMEHISTNTYEGDITSIDRFNELVSNEIVENSSSDGRIYSIKTGLEVFDDHKIVGTGFGTYGSSASLMRGSPIYEEYDIREGFYSDNEYIVILVETGVIGSLIALAFIGTIIYDNKYDLFKILACVVFGGLGMFYNVLETQGLAFLFWMTLAMPNYVERKYWS